MVVTGTLPVFNLTQDGPGEKKVSPPLGQDEACLGGCVPRVVWGRGGVGRSANWTGGWGGACESSWRPWARGWD